MRVFQRRLWVLVAMLPIVALGSAPTSPKVTFTDTKLKNGIRVLITEDHVAPVFSIAVTYNVGSRDERKGRTGFAHLFEHMMFKGSENIGAGEHFMLVFNNGGSMNGTTNKDRTLYFETLPANQLDLALFLEADRMRSLAITKDNLDNQRNAVQEERRSGVDNQPYGKTFEAIDELAYDNFAYEHSVIGSMEDLSAASVEDVAAFFKTYYAPNNAVLAVVGDVKTQEALAKIRKHFESIPSQPAPAAVDMTEAPQTAERRLSLDDALARLPRLDVVYKIPPAMSLDEYPLSVLGTVLGGGRSSRLYEQIVRQKQLALNVSAFAGTSRGPGLFRFNAMALPGKSVPDIESAVEAEIDKIKNGPIAGWEMEKARASARSALVSNVQSTLSRAILLSEYAMFYDNPGLINTRAEKIAAVTADDVQRVARQYLTSANRTVVVTSPKPATPSVPSERAQNVALAIRTQGGL
jgi:predicted Zn-dependent peptidase